ncbi:hypothetical protein [Blautia faecicola]|uniref:hypothetical protein n=1 Tax=Blautia faecicola TaxID=2509240 RepID=UPI00268CEA92
MSDSTKKTETFILNIYNRQNATWQGSVTWVEKKRKAAVPQRFRIIKTDRECFG